MESLRPRGFRDWLILAPLCDSRLAPAPFWASASPSVQWRFGLAEVPGSEAVRSKGFLGGAVFILELQAGFPGKEVLLVSGHLSLAVPGNQTLARWS